MPKFSFVVKDRNGKTHTGSLDAESRNALLEQLWKQELTVLSVDELTKGSETLNRLRAGGGVKLGNLVIFSRQLATLVEAGVSIVPSLQILADQMLDRTFKQIITKIHDDVEAGASLSEAAARHPQAFNELFVNLLHAGEQSGRLDEILDRLATYQEKSGELQRKVRSALIYPAFVTLLAFGITTFLLVGIVPKFRDIFSSLGGTLPLPTLMLLGVSDAMRRFWVLGLVGLIAAAVGGKVALSTPGGKVWFDQMSLQVPIFGPLIRKVGIARFARTLATLIKSGVPILGALDIVAKTAGNKIIERAVVSARASIREGENISDPLAESKVFPIMVTRMIAVGEKTGEMEKMLSKVADFYESEVDATVNALTSLIEPMVIAFLGIVIGGIAVTLLLPVFNITSLIK
jgi:type IV pilus assembly protein PilC